jgi:hypothetical protein
MLDILMSLIQGLMEISTKNVLPRRKLMIVVGVLVIGITLLLLISMVLVK